AVIIAPHYGWDAQTEESVELLLSQDYAGEYEVFLVTHAIGDSDCDPSYSHLGRLAEEYPHAHALLAPNVIDNSLPRSQKVQNLITAISELPDDVEIIAFVDADVTVREDWLRLLVEPLQDRRIGATVGARFYYPHTFNLPSLVEAIWVNFQIGVQGDHRFTMVWGGSNAIRRELISDANVLQRWENATIEDHNLTHAVRDSKLKVHFVPDCVVITHTVNRTWRQVLEFTNRQMIMTYRMGFPAQWGLSLAGLLPKALIVFTSIPLLPFYFNWPFRFNQLFVLLVLLIPFIEIHIYRIFSLNLPKVLRDMDGFRDNIRMTSFVTPISMFVAGLNAVYTVFQDKIIWGGVRYRILSATTCQVLGRVSEATDEAEDNQ
ncbi:MAG: glycosyltransferase family 2 protein, partial [Candidatus Poribacteria bacterium]|nr:glycosyltransferase family 2 protein [Candidatus Poribacteria bacterium]